MKRLMIIAVVLLLAASAVAEGEWFIETVDNTTIESQSISIAIDDQDNPHVAYISREYAYVEAFYAYIDNEIWNIQAIPESYNSAQSISMALDTHYKPHVVFNNYYGDTLHYTYMHNSSWGPRETVATDVLQAYFNSLALDSNDKPHISYCDLNDNSLYYAHKEGDEWINKYIDSIGHCNSIALDSSDHPHISYFGVKYAHWDGESWLLENVDSPGSYLWSTAIIVDDSGTPHIAYFSNQGLSYAYKEGSYWHKEIVDEGISGQFPSLALDEFGNPRISYYDGFWGWGSGNLNYAHWDGSAWQIEIIDDEGDVGAFTSLAIDSNGRTHISYIDRSNGVPKYARYNADPLAAFSLLSPVDGEQVPNWPLAAWELHNEHYRDVKYYLWYSTDPDFATYDVIEGIEVSEYQFTEDDLDRDTTYYWKVRATDGYLYTWSNETWSFHVAADASVERVELASANHDSGVLVSWTIDGETPLATRLLRGAESPVVISGELPGHLTSFLDMDIEAGNAYTYWLEVVEQGGATKRFGPTEARVPEAQHALTLHQPWPSPARDVVTVAFELAESGNVGLHVYDLAGRRVATLASGEHTAGRHELSWDCAA